MPPKFNRLTKNQLNQKEYSNDRKQRIYKRDSSKRSSNQSILNKRYNLRTKKIQIDSSSDEQQNWRTNLSKYMQNDNKQTKKQERIKQIKDKYPIQISNTKQKSIKIITRKKQQLKYQNVCSICLGEHQKIQGLLKCGHKFCFQCIEQWTKSSTNCPCCRTQFNQIIKINFDLNKIEKKRQIIKVQQKNLEFNQLDYFICQECNQGDDQDVLLICDSCDFYCCHVYCDPILNNIFPQNQWYCKSCSQNIERLQARNQLTSTQTISEIQIPRASIRRTYTLRPRNQQRQTDDQSSQQFESQQQDDKIQLQHFLRSHKQKRNSKLEKRHQDFRFLLPKDRLSSVINRITFRNNARQIRNLRRRNF